MTRESHTKAPQEGRTGEHEKLENDTGEDGTDGGTEQRPAKSAGYRAHQ
jgi:hypothetical protein